MSDFLANISSALAILGFVILLLISRWLFQKQQAESHLWLNLPLMFIAICWFVAIILVACSGIFKLQGH